MKWWWVLLALALATVTVLGAYLVWLSQTSLLLTPLFQNEPIEAEVIFPNGAPHSGDAGTIRVNVKREGQPFALYDSGYAIHLIVASVDFGGFLHTVDLRESQIGVYEFDVTFGPPGAYRLWVEVNDAHAEQHHGSGAGLFAYADFQVRGVGKAVPEPRVYGKQAEAGPYRVNLEYEPLRAGKQSEIRLTVKDSTGRSRQLTQPEPNIYVMVGPKGDPEFPFIRHGHGKPPRDGTTVFWQETFPTAGQYLLWTTVYLVGTNEKAQTEAVEVPFVLQVTE